MYTHAVDIFLYFALTILPTCFHSITLHIILGWCINTSICLSPPDIFLIRTAVVMINYLIFARHSVSTTHALFYHLIPVKDPTQ